MSIAGIPNSVAQLIHLHCSPPVAFLFSHLMDTADSTADQGTREQLFEEAAALILREPALRAALQLPGLQPVATPDPTSQPGQPCHAQVPAPVQSCSAQVRVESSHVQALSQPEGTIRQTSASHTQSGPTSTPSSSAAASSHADSTADKQRQKAAAIKKTTCTKEMQFNKTGCISSRSQSQFNIYLNKMKKLMLLLLCGHSVCGVEHSLVFYLSVCSGVSNSTDFMISGDFDEIGMVYFDNSMTAPEAKQDWVRESMEDDPQHWKQNALDSMRYQQLLQGETEGFRQNSSQSQGWFFTAVSPRATVLESDCPMSDKGVHVTQQILGCEWDDETEKVDGYKSYGYNGEDFITFDLQTETWIAANPHAEITKKEWDNNEVNNGFWKTFLTDVCPTWLKKYWKYASKALQRKANFTHTGPPSVSLLKKCTSSPISCFATGFYPDKAEMFWRRDGEQTHEDVDHGEILPNPDGTFQMRVHLDLSSVTAQDWSRYECVFQLSGMKDDIITKLDRAGIRTNWGNTGVKSNTEASSRTTPIVVVLVVLSVIIILITAVGVTVHKKNKAKRPSHPPEEGCELAENLNPDE
ncbi:major histocompatibility complex class I-related gene protein-like [Betta splendens]|uniref:Major histocompatibility complex class I-related gene protein-like n=1 Tax=Betta splendens TaxID=158456 RepID=A0A9W2Y4U7_BETSP|nr:major histocompatibility complex class I-related gene protein-like [Betta splendens]